jgi:hypothetical protein
MTMSISLPLKGVSMDQAVEDFFSSAKTVSIRHSFGLARSLEKKDLKNQMTDESMTYDDPRPRQKLRP